MGLSPELAKDFQKSKTYAKMIKEGNVAGLTEITLGTNPKKYKISAAFRKNILDLSTDHYNNPIITQSYDKIDSMVRTSQKTMGQALLKGGLGIINEKDIPTFTLGIEAKKGGGYTIAKTDKAFGKDGSPEYLRLLKKQASGKNLTDIEAKNLKLYGNLHLLNDGGLSNEQRSLVRRRVVKQLNSLNIPNKEYKLVNLNSKVGRGEVIPNTLTRVTVGADTWMTEITKKDVTTYGEAISNSQMNLVVTPAREVLKKEKLNPGSQSKEAIEASTKILENYKVKYNQSGVDVEDTILNGFKEIEENISRSTSRNTKLIAGNTIVLKKEGNEKVWSSLAGRVGVSTESKGDLIITPVIKDGVTTGEVTITTKSSGKEPSELKPVLISDKEASAAINAVIYLNKHTYNADRGESAPILNLGKGNYKGNMDKGLEPSKKALILNFAKESGNEKALQETQRMLKEYANGNYVVKYIPIGGRYYKHVLNASTGEDVFPGFAPPMEKIINDSEVDRLLSDPKQDVDQVFYDMMINATNYYINQD
jgi:hypothetical protein